MTSKKRLKNNKAIKLNPDDGSPREDEFKKAFDSINSDEPLSLGDFLQELNERMKKPKPE